MKRLAWVLCGLLAANLASAQTIYRWVDAEGRVHYTDERPPGQVATEEVALRPPPSRADVEAAQLRLDRLRADVNARREAQASDRERQDAEREVAEAEAAFRLSQCHIARDNLYNLEESGAPVYSLNANGEREYYDDERRAREIVEMRAAMARFCD